MKRALLTWGVSSTCARVPMKPFSVKWCGVVWGGIVWSGVGWCGVLWGFCGVVWSGVE